MDDYDRHQSWQNRAACNPYNAELFFAQDGARSEARFRRVQQAKAICNSCPVRKQCLGYALQTGQEFGVWGGFTAEERELMLKGGLGSTAIA